MVKVNSTQRPIPETLVYANSGRENIAVTLLNITSFKVETFLLFLFSFIEIHLTIGIIYI